MNRESFAYLLKTLKLSPWYIAHRTHLPHYITRDLPSLVQSGNDHYRFPEQRAQGHEIPLKAQSEQASERIHCAKQILKG